MIKTITLDKATFFDNPEKYIDLSKLVFEPVTIIATFENSFNQYEALIATPPAKNEKGMIAVLKPSKPYTSREFEVIFAFGNNCSGYDPNRCVGVKSATGYLYGVTIHE